MGQLPTRLCSKPFGERGLTIVRNEINRSDPPLRAEIARRVCEALQWVDIVGRPKWRYSGKAAFWSSQQYSFSNPSLDKSEESGLQNSVPVRQAAESGYAASVRLLSGVAGDVRGYGAVRGYLLPGGELDQSRTDDGKRQRRSVPQSKNSG